MKLQVGDIVRYLNDVGGGVVQKIINATQVEILDNSGFTLPIFEKDLVLIERPTAKTKQPEDQVVPLDVFEEVESEDIEGNDTPLVYLAFVRDAKNPNMFDSYIINDCNYNLLFVLSSESNNELTHRFSGLLESNTKMMAVQFSYDDISTFETLSLQGVFYKKRGYEQQNTIDVSIKINQVKFYKPGVFVVNDFFDNDAYVITAYDGASVQEKKVEKEKELLQSISPEKLKELILEKNDKHEQIEKPQKKDVAIREVDLHIHELVENDSNMLPAEMLEVQLRTFEKELANAAKSGIEKIVFIHGVGNGILKAKIRGRLDRDYPQYFYQDASFQQYKYGATLVYLRKVHK